MLGAFICCREKKAVKSDFTSVGDTGYACPDHGKLPIVGCMECRNRRGIWHKTDLAERERRDKTTMIEMRGSNLLWLCIGGALGALACFNLLSLYLLLSDRLIDWELLLNAGG